MGREESEIAPSQSLEDENQKPRARIPRLRHAQLSNATCGVLHEANSKPGPLQTKGSATLKIDAKGCATRQCALDSGTFGPEV